jgi:hypothetical protein
MLIRSDFKMNRFARDDFMVKELKAPSERNQPFFEVAIQL